MKRRLLGWNNCTLMSFILANTLLAGVGTSQPTDAAAKAINSLGLDLLRKTSKPDANALLSPYSIQSALAVAYGQEAVSAYFFDQPRPARVRLHLVRDEVLASS